MCDVSDPQIMQRPLNVAVKTPAGRRAPPPPPPSRTSVRLAAKLETNPVLVTTAAMKPMRKVNKKRATKSSNCSPLELEPEKEHPHVESPFTPGGSRRVTAMNGSDELCLPEPMHKRRRLDFSMSFDAQMAVQVAMSNLFMPNATKAEVQGPETPAQRIEQAHDEPSSLNLACEEEEEEGEKEGEEEVQAVVTGIPVQSAIGVPVTTTEGIEIRSTSLHQSSMFQWNAPNVVSVRKYPTVCASQPWILLPPAALTSEDAWGGISISEDFEFEYPGVKIDHISLDKIDSIYLIERRPFELNEQDLALF